ncbi:branched-chain amino acid ABC transporter permease [Candidatus Bathyarchaeota archaeon]|nr:branched-chain amino acid ABC transporter permease [Candidatus Bathyarchaeota archaeon]MBS7618416.1 branched-chain amino acid ABC transporter permease [Candidatus Bathyarchaeota archaeon]
MADPLMYLLDAVAYAGIFGILSISLNFEYGYTNLANFGKVAFFMIGAYVTAIMSSLKYPFIVNSILAILITGVIGVLTSLPALRLKEDFLAITMITLGEVMKLIIKNEEWLAGGVWGISGIAPAIVIPGLTFRERLIIQIALIYGILIACYFICELIVKSPYGRVLKTIREDELIASTYGKNVFKYKVQVFAVGSAMSGLAGGLFAQYIGTVNPYMFEPTVTFAIWMMVILGGPANNLGAILGAFMVEGFQRSSRLLKDYLNLPLDPVNLQVMLTAILVITVVFYRPQGLLKEKIKPYEGSLHKIIASKFMEVKSWIRRS